MKTHFIIFNLILFSIHSFSTTWNIGTSGFAFSPATSNIILGDDVNFLLNGTDHDVVEVSKSTFDANGTSPLSGGFSVGTGENGLVLSAKLTAGTHYYVCTPHVGSHGMKGTIIVQSSTAISAQSTYGMTFLTYYPNPGIREGFIEIELTIASKMNLALSDIQGRQIKRIFENKTFPSGKQTIAVDLNGLPTGAYILDLKGKNYNKKIKAIIN